MMKNTKKESIEEKIIDEQNKQIWLETIKSPILDKSGKPAEASGIAHDIRQRKQVQEALRESEAHYRALADATFESVFISENGICLETNQTACDMFGYDYDELIGIFGTDVIAPESKALVESNMLAGYEEPYEVIAQKKDGSTFYAEIRGKMTEYKGKTVRVTVVNNIDRRKQAEAALKKSEKRFRTLVENAPFGLSIMKPDKTMEYLNPRFTEIFGYTLDDIPDKSVWFEKAYPDENYRDQVRLRWMQDSSKSDDPEVISSRSFKVECKNGLKKIIRFKSVALPDGKQLLSYEDITCQTEAEQTLRESEERYRQMFESNRAIKLLIDPIDNAIVDANQAACQFYGYSKADIVRQKLTDFHVLSQDNPETGTGAACSGKRPYFQLSHKLASGEVREVEVYSGPIIIAGKTYLNAVIHDITEKKLLQDQLIRSERLAATGRLAASIAHEINSPLQGLIALLDLLKNNVRQDKKLSGVVDLLKSAFDSIRNTVAKLLDLNRPANEKRQVVQVNDIIQDKVALLQSYLKKKKVRVNLALTQNIEEITAFPHQLGQVFMNLINNAVEAMTGVSHQDDRQRKIAGSGEITITSTQTKGQIVIEVSDSGPGISEKDLQHIFDPFYTCKKTLGMGIGLSVCHSIIREHCGTITACNLTGGGATFRIVFPVVGFSNPS